jgi:hypothetical protein
MKHFYTGIARIARWKNAAAEGDKEICYLLPVTMSVQLACRDEYSTRPRQSEVRALFVAKHNNMIIVTAILPVTKIACSLFKIILDNHFLL